MKGTKMPPSPPLYYFAAWTDSGCLCGCDHYHMSVASAVACTWSAYAGAYVVAVEKGEYRALNDKEEAEFQFHMYGWGKQAKKQEFALLPWPNADPEPTD
jgi:hypothetical protein